MIHYILSTCDSKSFQMPNLRSSKQLTTETHRGHSQLTWPSWLSQLSLPLAPPSLLTPARRLRGREDAPRTSAHTWLRGHVTPSRHGGGAAGSRLPACSGRPVLLHGGPRLRALPDAGGAGAAGGHTGEWASLRTPEGRRKACPAPFPARVRRRPRKATRPPCSQTPADRGDYGPRPRSSTRRFCNSGRNRQSFFPTHLLPHTSHGWSFFFFLREVEASYFLDSFLKGVH